MIESTLSNDFARIVRTADGRPWVQICYVCKRNVELLKDKQGNTWVRAGEYKRHRRCSPGILK